MVIASSSHGPVALHSTPALCFVHQPSTSPWLASMDDEALYGPVAYRLSHADAVAAGVVAPLKLVFLKPTESAARLLNESAILRNELAGQPVSRDVQLALAIFDGQRRCARARARGRPPRPRVRIAFAPRARV